METAQQLVDFLAAVPRNFAQSVGMIPTFTLLDFVGAIVRSRLARSLDVSAMTSKATLHLFNGFMTTSRMNLWGNYAGDDGTGFEYSIENLKKLPQNTIDSWPYPFGYAFLDYIYENFKTYLLEGQDQSTLTYQATIQAVNALKDASDIIYWGNRFPNST